MFYQSLGREAEEQKKRDQADVMGAALEAFTKRADDIAEITYRIQGIGDYKDKEIKNIYEKLRIENENFSQMDMRQKSQMILAELLKKGSKGKKKPDQINSGFGLEELKKELETAM